MDLEYPIRDVAVLGAAVSAGDLAEALSAAGFASRWWAPELRGWARRTAAETVAGCDALITCFDSAELTEQFVTSGILDGLVSRATWIELECMADVDQAWRLQNRAEAAGMGVMHAPFVMLPHGVGRVIVVRCNYTRREPYEPLLSAVASSMTAVGPPPAGWSPREDPMRHYEAFRGGFSQRTQPPEPGAAA